MICQPCADAADGLTGPSHPDPRGPAADMSVLTSTRTARKTRRCSMCLAQIHPGDQYEAHSMTPGDEMNDGRYWRHTATHVECPPTRYDSLWSETREDQPR